LYIRIPFFLKVAEAIELATQAEVTRLFDATILVVSIRLTLFVTRFVLCLFYNMMKDEYLKLYVGHEGHEGRDARRRLRTMKN
jgi:hypothetical protein